jgi:hypothetical protein
MVSEEGETKGRRKRAGGKRGKVVKGKREKPW